MRTTDHQPLPPALCREIASLYRAGLSKGSIVIVINRYHNHRATYGQVAYYLSKARISRPRISKGRVIA